MSSQSVGGHCPVDGLNSAAGSLPISEIKSDKNPISALAERAFAFLQKMWDNLKSLASWLWSLIRPSPKIRPSPEQNLVRGLLQGMGDHYEESMVAFINTIPVNERIAFVEGVKSLMKGVSEEETLKNFNLIFSTFNFLGWTESTRDGLVHDETVPRSMSLVDLQEIQRRKDFNGRGYITNLVAKELAKIPHPNREYFVREIQPLIEGVARGVDLLQFIEKLDMNFIFEFILNPDPLIKSKMIDRYWRVFRENPNLVVVKSLLNPSMTLSDRMKIVDSINRYNHTPDKWYRLNYAEEVAKPLADTGKMNGHVGSLLWSCSDLHILGGTGQLLKEAIEPLLSYYSNISESPIFHLIEKLSKLEPELWLPFTQTVFPILKDQVRSHDVGEVLRAFIEMNHDDWTTVSEAATSLISQRYLTDKDSFGDYAYLVIQIVKSKPTDERKAFSDAMVPLIQDVRSGVDLLSILNPVQSTSVSDQ